jgi:cardiolipin synthase
MEYYIFRNDISGKKIKKALIQKAKQGIEVRFLYDNVGSWFVPPQFYHEMKTDGVKVSPFMKVKASPLIRGRFSALRKKINYHNHRKIVVIDGKI